MKGKCRKPKKGKTSINLCENRKYTKKKTGQENREK